jgi:hypothetical protein
MKVFSPADVRAAIGDHAALDDEDYELLAASANADPHEGAEWLPYYKIALGLLMQGFGVLDATVEFAPATAAVARRNLACARALMELSNHVAATGPALAPAEAPAPAETPA